MYMWKKSRIGRKEQAPFLLFLSEIREDKLFFRFSAYVVCTVSISKCFPNILPSEFHLRGRKGMNANSNFADEETEA